MIRRPPRSPLFPYATLSRSWLVVGLKLLGAAVALLSVTKRPPFLPPGLLGVMVWSVFATLAVYVLGGMAQALGMRSEEHTSELQSRQYLVCRLLLEKKKHMM